MNGRKRPAINAQRQFLAWMDLVDFSTQLALAGMRTQGLSESRAWKIWCQRWARAAREHQQANLRIVRRLRERDKPFQP